MSTTAVVSISEEVIARQAPEAQAIIRGLLEVIAQKQRRIEELERRNAQLETRVAELEDEVRRLRGLRGGHRRQERALIPVEDCREVIACTPMHWRRCRHQLTGRDAQPLRHQVMDLPDLQLDVVEYQRHRLTCSHCGASTCGPLPAGCRRAPPVRA